jgi:dihydroxyacetone kinase-like protein
VLNLDGFGRFISAYARRLADLQSVLNELDNRIGDGDHGTNMARGFRVASEKLSQTTVTDLGNACSAVAMALLGSVGGVSGPLYSTVFMKFAAAWKGATTVDFESLREAIKSALEGLEARGKAKRGEKTLIDVWLPVVECLYEEETAPEEALKQCVKVAQQAAIDTKPLRATKGRAAYLGDRSKGTCDPGSVSSAVFFEELVDVVVGGVERIEWQTSAL